MNITTPLNLTNRTVTSLLEQLSQMGHKAFDHFPEKNYTYQLWEVDLHWNSSIKRMPLASDLVSAVNPIEIIPAVRLIFYLPYPLPDLTYLVDYFPDYKKLGLEFPG